MNSQEAKKVVDDIVSAINDGDIYLQDLIYGLSKEKRQFLRRLLLGIEEKPRILVWVDGGLIESVSANQMAIDLGVDVVVADYDVEGSGATIHKDLRGDNLLIIRHSLDLLQDVGVDIIEQSLRPETDPVVEDVE